MDSEEYTKEALRSKPEYKDWLLSGEEAQILNGAMGLSGEAGEVLDHVKKVLFQGHELSRPKLIEELGDVAWYIVCLCDALGIKFSDVLAANNDKLRARYPEGFEVERSVKREVGKRGAWCVVVDAELDYEGVDNVLGGELVLSRREDGKVEASLADEPRDDLTRFLRALNAWKLTPLTGYYLKVKHERPTPSD